MAKNWLFAVSFLSAAMVTGCSRSTPLAAVPKTVAPPSMAAATPTLPNPGAVPSSDPAAKPDKIVASSATTVAPAATPFSDLGDLFAPPKITAPPVTPEPEREPEPEPQVVAEPKKRPALRLIGFVEVEVLKALLSVNGKLNVVTVGESVEGIELAGIQPPSVTLKDSVDGEEFQLNLFEQSWARQPSAINSSQIGGAKPGVQIPAHGRKTAAPTNTPPRIPGFNASDIPGFQGYPTPNGSSVGESTRTTKSGQKANSEDGPPKLPKLPGLPGGFSPAALPGSAKKQLSE